MGADRDTIALRESLAQILPRRPFRIDLWDGTTVAPDEGNGALAFRLRSPLALGHILRAPGQLGLGRAYVSGEIDVNDIDLALETLDSYTVPPIDNGAKVKLIAAAVRAGALNRIPHAPAAELRPRGRRHSRERDQRAVTHHYDVSNEFFELMLGPSLVYSCAIFSRGATTLEEAQATKLELVCSKLGLKAGERVLDVGCGWGALRCMPRASTASTSPASPCRTPGATGAQTRGRRRAVRQDRDPPRRLPRPRR